SSRRKTAWKIKGLAQALANGPFCCLLKSGPICLQANHISPCASLLLNGSSEAAFQGFHQARTFTGIRREHAMMNTDPVNNRHEAKLGKESSLFCIRSIEECRDAGRGMAARRSQAAQCAYTAIHKHIRKCVAATGGRPGLILFTIYRPDDPQHV